MKRWTFVVIALALLVGCDATPPQGYFPLTGGLQWHYRVSRSDALGNHQTGERVLTNLGPATFDNEQVFERRNSFGTHYYINARADGYYRVAKRRAVDHFPQPDLPPRTVLPLPPQIGAHWRHTTSTYLLQRVFPFHKPFQYRAAIYMDFRVAARSLEVTVPAGRFTGCVRVDGEARIQVASDPRIGMSDVPLIQSEWYCPGAGLVRLTRQEKLYTDQGSIIGGRLEMVLLRLDDGNPWTGLWHRVKGWF